MSYSNAVTLISGPSGSGKTSLIATAAEWLWDKHKKVLRLYTCDGGGYSTKMQALIQAGIVQVWRMRTRATAGAEGLIEETCLRASNGWWPTEFTDVEKGEVPSGVALSAPTLVTYTMLCPQKHVVNQSTVRASLTAAQCPTCKVLVNTQNCTIDTVEQIAPGFEQVGACAFDGLTSMSDWIMMALSDRVGRGELAGEKPAIGGIIRSGGMAFGSSNRAHYGFAQNQAEKWLLGSTSIPNLTLAPIWTALETRVDEGNGMALPMYGPSIAGQAKTAKVPQWVGNYLGAQFFTDEKGRKSWRLYLNEYRGEDGFPHHYKVRSDPGMLPDYLVDPPGQYFSEFNLGKFFDLLDAATQRSLTLTKERFKDAPGLPSGKPVAAAPQPVSQPPAPVPAPVSTPSALPPLPGRPAPAPSMPARPPIAPPAMKK